MTETSKFTDWSMHSRREGVFMRDMEEIADQMLQASVTEAIGPTPEFKFGALQGLGPPQSLPTYEELNDDDALQPWERKLRERASKIVEIRLMAFYEAANTTDTPEGSVDVVVSSQPPLPSLPLQTALTTPFSGDASTSPTPATDDAVAAQLDKQRARLNKSMRRIPTGRPGTAPAKPTPVPRTVSVGSASKLPIKQIPLPIAQIEIPALPLHQVQPVSGPFSATPSSARSAAVSVAQALRYAESMGNDKLFDRAAIEQNVLQRVRSSRLSSRQRDVVS
eukprot:TRINITY_DN559_c0_g1_i1.p1 TRINITY_DN559_c0_g1~~TRINITY_DN559_c0_g1_i1.p1  ORF type:complete len:279 (+),score=52.39 TRINITY_DN559_c0_g1_i1:303-1139(+)